MKIRNIETLRNDILDAFDMVKKDASTCDQGDSMANLAGKAINSVKVQLEYAGLRSEKPEIDFLNVT